jgi:hypothetical protein
MRTETSSQRFERSLESGRVAEQAMRNYIEWRWPEYAVMPELRAPDRAYCGPRISVDGSEYRSPDIITVTPEGYIHFFEVKRKSRLYYSKELRCHVVEIDEACWKDYVAVYHMNQDRFSFTIAVINELDRQPAGRYKEPDCGLYTCGLWRLEASYRTGSAKKKGLFGKTVIEFPLNLFEYAGRIDWCYP